MSSSLWDQSVTIYLKNPIMLAFLFFHILIIFTNILCYLYTSAQKYLHLEWVISLGGIIRRKLENSDTILGIACTVPSKKHCQLVYLADMNFKTGKYLTEECSYEMEPEIIKKVHIWFIPGGIR